MSKTQENLQEAFAGESQANRKYLAFAKQADKEGYPQAAKLFRAAAAAETIHAHAHLRAMNGIGKTVENLKAAIEGETFEFKEMYPAMIATAQEEEEKDAEKSFSYANTVEAIHAALYQKALDNIASAKECDYFVCPVCGYTCENDPAEKCPVCSTLAKAFLKVE